MHKLRVPSTLGAMDGLTFIIGLVIGLAVSRQSGSAVWHAAISGGVAEFAGMTAGQHEATPEAGWLVALACGVAAGLAIIAPAVPYAFLTGTLAAALTLALAAGAAALVTLWRPESGWQAVLRTYGVLGIAALLCAGANLL